MVLQVAKLTLAFLIFVAYCNAQAPELALKFGAEFSSDQGYAEGILAAANKAWKGDRRALTFAGVWVSPPEPEMHLAVVQHLAKDDAEYVKLGHDGGSPLFGTPWLKVDWNPNWGRRQRELDQILLLKKNPTGGDVQPAAFADYRHGTPEEFLEKGRTEGLIVTRRQMLDEFSRRRQRVAGS